MNLIKKISEYKLNLIKLFLEDPSNKNSGRIHNYLQKTMGKEQAPSRASVINFLNELVDLEYLKFYEESGKGGFHRQYYLDMSSEEFISKMFKDTQEALDLLLKIIQ